MIIKISVILGIIALMSMAAYNSGYNKGYDTATKIERESCEHQLNNKSCTYIK